MPIWTKPEGSTDIRCPAQYCSSYLFEVAPGVFQCWQCLRWKSFVCSFFEIAINESHYSAVCFVLWNKADYRYQIGDVTWRLNKWGQPGDVGGGKHLTFFSKLVDIPPEEESLFPLPVVPNPWPHSGWPKALEKWNPAWTFPQAAGPKELVQQGGRPGRS